MIFTENLLKILCEKDPNISFLLNTHEVNNKEERICFYDSLTHKQYTFCFNYSEPTLRIFIVYYADFSKSERVRKHQIEKTLVPLIIPAIKQHPTFRIKLTLKECFIKEHSLNEELEHYSFNDFLENELHQTDYYPIVFFIIFIGSCIGLFILNLMFTNLSSMLPFLIAIILNVSIAFVFAFFFTFILYFSRSCFIAAKQCIQMKKMKKLEKGMMS